MSLAIQVENVIQVQVGAKWHFPQPGTFTLDAYEYLDGEILLLGGGTNPLIPATGAGWVEEVDAGDGNWITANVYCPLTSIRAVRCKS